MWFTETPWPPVILLGAMGFLCGLVWGSTQRGKYLVVGLGCIAAAVVVWFVERQIVTEAEVIEQNVHDLVAAFHRNDLEATVSFFSEQAALLRTMVAGGVAMADIADDYRITDMDVRTMAQDSMGESWFRANVTATVPVHHVANYRLPTRWRLLWRKEGGEWKIIEVHRYDVVADREIPLFGRDE
jgi:ketosteroid isomerase-like protein